VHRGRLVWAQVSDLTVRDRASVIVALVSLGVSSAMVLLILPLLVAEATDKYGLDSRAAGWIAAADMIGAAIGMAFIARRLAELDSNRTAFGGASLLIAGNLAAVFAPSVPWLFAVRLLTGFGAGMGLGIANAGLSRTSQPERNIGIYIVAALVSGAVVLRVFPTLSLVQGVDGLFGFLAAVACLPVVLSRFVSLSSDRGSTVRPDETRWLQPGQSSPLAAVAAIGGIFTYFIGVGVLWANMQPLGMMRGIDKASIGTALGLASLLGAGGGLGSIVLGTRWGRFWPVSLMFAASLGATGLLELASVGGYFASASLILMGWNFVYPYLIGTLVTVDPTARLVPLAGSMQLLGIALGPALGAALFGTTLYVHAPAIGAVCYLLAYLLAAPTIWIADRRQPAVLFRPLARK
jgi:MFS family permease